MKKNVLVITASSREEGNSKLLGDAFVKGLLVNDNHVERFDTGKMTINPCRACDAYYRGDNACVFNDDFNLMAPHFLNSDIIVFVTPIYWYSFPSSIKAAIDKMYAFIVGEKESKIKSAMLLTCGEFDDLAVFEGLKKSYELILNDRGWEDIGQLIVPGVNKVGDILKTSALDKAETMGKSI